MLSSVRSKQHAQQLRDELRASQPGHLQSAPHLTGPRGATGASGGWREREVDASLATMRLKSLRAVAQAYEQELARTQAWRLQAFRSHDRAEEAAEDEAFERFTRNARMLEGLLDPTGLPGREGRGEGGRQGKRFSAASKSEDVVEGGAGGGSRKAQRRGEQAPSEVSAGACQRASPAGGATDDAAPPQAAATVPLPPPLPLVPSPLVISPDASGGMEDVPHLMASGGGAKACGRPRQKEAREEEAREESLRGVDPEAGMFCRWSAFGNTKAEGARAGSGEDFAEARPLSGGAEPRWREQPGSTRQPLWRRQSVHPSGAAWASRRGEGANAEADQSKQRMAAFGGLLERWSQRTISSAEDFQSLADEYETVMGSSIAHLLCVPSSQGSSVALSPSEAFAPSDAAAAQKAAAERGAWRPVDHGSFWEWPQRAVEDGEQGDAEKRLGRDAVIVQLR
eukprot:TRINITY_DN572_c1_g1_i1.p1 TRINITY_DN572_c1_g1~~TRINITY_DN572_c1_g1_i1.p1  ORF type:complete len:454 (+),score=100.70 TRINITY_DN572_c1_g1_i1:2724-4085(+)